MKNRPADGEENVVVHGTGDVFADLGIVLSPEDRVKMLIARQISRAIVEKGLTQVEVAKVLEIDQGKVSNITRGRLNGFSIERLIRYVTALGWDVNIELAPSADEHGHVIVRAEGQPLSDGERIMA